VGGAAWRRWIDREEGGGVFNWGFIKELHRREGCERVGLNRRGADRV